MGLGGVPWRLRAGSVLSYFANKSKVPLVFCLGGALSFLACAQPLNSSLLAGRADSSPLCSSQWTRANCRDPAGPRGSHSSQNQGTCGTLWCRAWCQVQSSTGG